MAIKIVDETPDPAVVKKVSCRQCGVRLEYLPIDVEEYVRHDYGGGSDIVYYIECPKCKNDITVGRT